MGFEEPTKTLRLTFRDPDYAGAEVRCRARVPLAVYFEIARASEGGAEAAERAMRLFGDDVLEAWNIERDGRPLPATGEGMLSISPEFSTMILAGWTEAVASVPDPLGEASPPGLAAVMQPLNGQPS